MHYLKQSEQLYRLCSLILAIILAFIFPLLVRLIRRLIIILVFIYIHILELHFTLKFMLTNNTILNYISPGTYNQSLTTTFEAELTLIFTYTAIFLLIVTLARILILTVILIRKLKLILTFLFAATIENLFCL